MNTHSICQRTHKNMVMLECESCHVLQNDTEMWAYSFEHHVHHVCRVCNDTDARHEYANEVQAINQDYLTLLQQEWRDSKQQLLELEQKDKALEASIVELQKKQQDIGTEIYSCQEKQRKTAAHIAALTETLERGLLSQTQVQNQDKRRALRLLKGKVYRKLPPADDRSLAWMMLAHSRLGNGTDCRAGMLAGQDLVLDMIRKMCLVKSAMDTQKQNCENLLSIVRALARKDPSSIIAKIDNAREQSNTHMTAEEGVLGHLGVLEMNKDEQETLRHMFFSTEFENRGLIERRRMSYPKVSSRFTEQSVSERIENYTAGMIYCVQTFPTKLVSVTMPSGASCLLRVIANEHYDDDDEDGNILHTNITQGDNLRAPVVSFDSTYGCSTGGFYAISLYNLGTEDLLFSDDPIEKSAQLHEGDFLFRCNVNSEVPKHNNNIVPGHGFGFLPRFPESETENGFEFHLRDVNNKVVLTFVL